MAGVDAGQQTPADAAVYLFQTRDRLQQQGQIEGAFRQAVGDIRHQCPSVEVIVSIKLV